MKLGLHVRCLHVRGEVVYNYVDWFGDPIPSTGLSHPSLTEEGSSLMATWYTMVCWCPWEVCLYLKRKSGGLGPQPRTYQILYFPLKLLTLTTSSHTSFTINPCRLKNFHFLQFHPWSAGSSQKKDVHLTNTQWPNNKAKWREWKGL